MIDKNGNVRVKVGSTVEVAQYSNGGSYLKYSGGERIDPEQEVATLISSLQSIQNEYKGEYTDLVTNGIEDCGCYGDCSCAPTYYVFGLRPANEMERDFYETQKREREAEQEARDRAELARLREKLGE